MISPSMVRRILTPPHTSMPSSASIRRLERSAQEHSNEVIHTCEAEFDRVGQNHLELDNALITPIYSAPYRFAHNEIGPEQLVKEVIEVLHALRWRCSVQLTVLHFATAITKSLERSRLGKLKRISWDNEPTYIGAFFVCSRACRFSTLAQALRARALQDAFLLQSAGSPSYLCAFD